MTLGFPAVQGDAMEIGRSYAYREKRGPDTPMLRVKLLDKVGRRGKSPRTVCG